MAFYFPLPERIIKSKVKYDCEKCNLKNKSNLRNPVIKPFIGKQYNGLVIVADKPSIEDDLKSIPLINEKAHLIRSNFLKNHINVANQTAVTYAACCQSKRITDTQYKCCRDILALRLIDLKPKLIVTLGEMAFKSVMGIKNKIGIRKIRNRIIPNFEFNCIVFPIFDPNEINSGNYRFAVEQDIKRISNLWHNNYYKQTYINQLIRKRQILKEITIHEVKQHEIDDIFKQIHLMEKVSLDYETTNVDPFDDFFEITHISFGLKKLAYVFHESLWNNDLQIWNKIQSNMVSILTNPKILKVIQNSKFEDLASRYVFKIKRIENSFCTMLATHVIDERRGCTSLDFQNLTRFGIPPYSDTVKSFLEKKNKDDKCNRIRQAPHNDMITYAGLDVITTFNQYEVLTNELLPTAYDKAYSNYVFLHRGHNTFANMTQRGIPIGGKEYEEIELKLDHELGNIIQEISIIPEFINYNKYLEEKNNLCVKKGDSKIKEFIESTKREEKKNNDLYRQTTIGSKRTIKSINRKISFS